LTCELPHVLHRAGKDYSNGPHVILQTRT
jgi:hypothetical protein